MEQRNIWLASLIAGVFLAVPAFASVPAVFSHVSAYKVDKGGHVEPIHGAVVRGEKVEYRATYTNLSHGSVHDLPATLSVPDGLYLVKAKNSPSPSVSLDGRAFHKLVLKGSQRSASGTRPVDNEGAHCRFIRWNVPDLPPGRTQVVYAVFRVGK